MSSSCGIHWQLEGVECRTGIPIGSSTKVNIRIQFLSTCDIELSKYPGRINQFIKKMLHHINSAIAIRCAAASFQHIFSYTFYWSSEIDGSEDFSPPQKNRRKSQTWVSTDATAATRNGCRGYLLGMAGSIDSSSKKRQNLWEKWMDPNLSERIQLIDELIHELLLGI